VKNETKTTLEAPRHRRSCWVTLEARTKIRVKRKWGPHWLLSHGSKWFSRWCWRCL